LYTTLRENDIRKFISKNKGCSSQAIVDAFSGKYSRVTVFDTIDSLRDFELITVLPNAENRQTNSIFLGNGSIISRVDAELESLETAINGVILKMNPDAGIDVNIVYTMAGLVLNIFSDVIRDFTICAVMKWPQETNSKKEKIKKRILERAYFILFSRISRIVAKIAREYPFPDESGMLHELIINYLASGSQQSRDDLTKLKNLSRNSSVEENVNELINAIREISENENLEQKSRLLATL
jgi:hypothetical protein